MDYESALFARRIVELFDSWCSTTVSNIAEWLCNQAISGSSVNSCDGSTSNLSKKNKINADEGTEIYIRDMSDAFALFEVPTTIYQEMPQGAAFLTAGGGIVFNLKSEEDEKAFWWIMLLTRRIYHSFCER